jgi:glycosyltransferase involved in cell wall biosynthesis
MSRNPPGVLIIDQGASFGGSALVASVIANRMPPERYRIHLATAADPAVLRIVDPVQPRVRFLAKRYDYVRQARTRERLASLPRPFRRMGGWSDTALRLVRNRKYIDEIRDWVTKADIAVIHLNNGFENLEAHLAARLTRSPVIVHAHGPCGDSYISRRLAPHVPACVAISHAVVKSFESIGTPKERISLLQNPLTVEPGTLDRDTRVRVRARHGIPADLPIAGIVGRIVAWKGQREFLQAVAEALKVIPGAGAVVIGDVTDDSDAYGMEVRDEAIRLGIQDRVWFTGFLGDPAEAYALLDVLVHSSIDPEPFGLVLTEAMAFGIPVVAAGTGGPVEIITDRVDGFLTDPLDPAGVGVVLARLLQDPGLRDRIGSAGRAAVVRRFDPAAYVDRMGDVYDQVLAGDGAAAS